MAGAPVPKATLFLELARDATRYHKHYRPQPRHPAIAARRLSKLQRTNMLIALSQQRHEVHARLVPRPSETELHEALHRIAQHFGTTRVAWNLDKVRFLQPLGVTKDALDVAIFDCSDWTVNLTKSGVRDLRRIAATLAGLNLLHILAGPTSLPEPVRADLALVAAAALNVPSASG